jgi:acetyl/propionyl-CoA carboxylase alpha subunit
VEFLLGPGGSFYFLEMNARLQVEHPVTELVTGLDLVRMQIEVAQGGSVPAQDDVTFRGHAIEARLCAEDPRQRFLPSSGRLLRVQWPQHVRVDTGVGGHVGTHYDSLLAKIVAWGVDREEARRKLVAALHETVVLGVVTNQPYLVNLLEGEAFVSGETYTTTVDGAEYRPREAPRILAVAAALALRERRPGAASGSPWSTVGYWRLG